MNPSPRKRWLGFEGDPTNNPGCGLLAMENVKAAWWQSRMTVAGARAPLPLLTDLPALARSIRQEAANGCP